MKVRTGLLITAAAVLSSAPPLGAQLLDHLFCVKVRDNAAKTTYSVQTGGDFIPFTTCTLQVPARLACYRATKFTVSPPPPGGGPASPPTTAKAYLCYKMKCSNSNKNIQDLKTDQFGSHALTFAKNSVYCSPASPSGAFLEGRDLF